MRNIEKWSIDELLDELFELGVDIGIKDTRNERNKSRKEAEIVKAEIKKRMEEV